jgi:hypothetical protein
LVRGVAKLERGADKLRRVVDKCGEE